MIFALGSPLLNLVWNGAEGALPNNGALPLMFCRDVLSPHLSLAYKL
jgi:hypothetical protein